MFSDLKKILELKIMIVKANKIEVEDKGSNNRLVLWKYNYIVNFI